MFKSLNKGWQVVLAGLLINIITGFPYAWSIFASGLTREMGWAYTQASLPYTVFLFVYAPSMALAGRLQDRYNPRLMVAVGGILMGGASAASAFALVPAGVVITWGIFWGLGLACSYASVTPAAIKWFPPQQKGLVTGIVVFGTGLSALILAPLCHFSIEQLGLQRTFFLVGVLILLGLLWLARLVVNPPLREDGKEKPGESGEQLAASSSPFEIFRYYQFYLLWLLFCIFAGTGVTFVSHMDTISRTQAAFEMGFIIVALFSLFNAAGRLAAGYFSDRLGRMKTISGTFLVLTVVLGLALFSHTPLLLGVVVSVVGFSYGSMFTLFPATVAVFFGEKNLGLHYGLVFTALMAGSFFPLVAGYLYELKGDFLPAYIILMFLNLLAFFISLLVKKPR